MGLFGSVGAVQQTLKTRLGAGYCSPQQLIQSEFPDKKDNVKVRTLRYPTGLLFGVTKSIQDFSMREGLDFSAHDEIVCLLQHDVVSLNPLYKGKALLLPQFISKEMCDSIISSAESYAESNGGWTADRHTGYPTTDIPVDEIFGAFSSIEGLISGEVLPRICEHFELEEKFLRIGRYNLHQKHTSSCSRHTVQIHTKTHKYTQNDSHQPGELFVAKYEFCEGKQSSLGPHRDGTPWSFVITLNQPDVDFVGGGTRLLDEGVVGEDGLPTGVVHRPTDAGGIVAFNGKGLHEGEREGGREGGGDGGMGRREGSINIYTTHTTRYTTHHTHQHI